MATTYVVRTNNENGFDTRSSDSMAYTHAVVSPEGWARTWHKSEANARKALTADLTGYKVVKAEKHDGTKATVTKRLTAELAAAKATEAPAPAPRKGRSPGTAAAAVIAEAAAAVAEPKAPRTLAATEGSMKCRVCREAKPLTSFPTKAANKAGEVLRDDRCRACRSEARDAKKAAAAKPAKGKKA